MKNDDNGEPLPPDLFETSSCSASTCVVVSNFVCFQAANRNQAYSISYTVVADFDVRETLTTEVMVEMDNGSNNCDVATTACVDG